MFNFLVLVSAFYKLPFYGFLHPLYHNDIQPAILVMISDISKNTVSILKPLNSIKAKSLKTSLPNRNNVSRPNNSTVESISFTGINNKEQLVTSSNTAKYYRIQYSLNSSSNPPLLSRHSKPSSSYGKVNSSDKLDVKNVSLNGRDDFSSRHSPFFNGYQQSKSIQTKSLSASAESINQEQPYNQDLFRWSWSSLNSNDWPTPQISSSSSRSSGIHISSGISRSSSD